MKDLAIIAAALGAAADVPRSLLGLPIVVAPNAPSHQVTLADLAEIAFAAAPIDVAISDASALEMTSAPVGSLGALGSPADPVPTELISLYQNDLTAFKISRY